jgi:predicted Zn-dependent protease
LLFLDSRYEQAKGLIAAGKLREAQSVLRSLRRRFPGSIVVHRMLYSVLMKDERTEEADKLFRDFMKQQRESWKPEP